MHRKCSVLLGLICELSIQFGVGTPFRSGAEVEIVMESTEFPDDGISFAH